MRNVCVVGIGSTKYGKLPETGREMLMSSCMDAIDDAGIDAKELGGAFIGNAFAVTERQGHVGPILMSALGIPDKPAATIESACASGATAFREAWLHVASGLSDAYLATGMEKISNVDTITATGYFAYGSDHLFEGGNGCSFPGLYAAMAQAHMHEHGTTEEDLAEIAVKNHHHAKDNPKAHLPKEITVEDVLSSMEVASPLHFFDCCPFSDGAAAAILCTEEMAKKLTDTPIHVLGTGRRGSVAALHDRDSLTSIPGTRLAADDALKMAGKTVQDMDLLEVHDCFTIAEAVALEDLGLYASGEGAKQAREGTTYRDGRTPVNPSGGLKAKGHPVGATGVGQIVETVQQLRGEGGRRQVDGAELALTHNVGATGGSVAVHVFGRNAA